MLNLVFSFQNAFQAQNILQIIGWSSIGSTRFFILLIEIKKNIFNVFLVFFIYSIILWVIFFNSSNIKKNTFLIMVILFGVPPISMFIFKVYFLMQFLILNILWYYLILLSFFLFGVSYFIFFIRERNNILFLNKNLNKIKIFIFLFFLFIVISF